MIIIDLVGKKKVPKVRIKGKERNLLHVMCECFLPEIKSHQDLSFRVHKSGRIPLWSIKVKNIFSEQLPESEHTLMKNFRCAIKASSANQRCEKQVSDLQVFLSLKIHNFKCIYCATKLNEYDWHLDHYHPLSRGGKNFLKI